MKLFASDFDGTFCRHTKEGFRQIPMNNKAVNHWRAKGHYFIFATGRGISAMKHELSNNHQTDYDYIVGLNGAIIVDKEDKIIFQEIINKEVASEIISFITGEGYLSFMVSDGFTGALNVDLDAEPQTKNIEKQFHEKGLFNLSLSEALSRPVSQISVMEVEPEKVHELAYKLSGRFKNQVVIYPNRKSIDISPLNTSKALGIKRLELFLNLAPQDIFCIGDSWNDIEMIESYKGFAMSDAPNQIKTKASKVFSTVEEAITSLTL